MDITASVNIKLLRKRNKLTQHQFAKKYKIPRGRLASWETKTIPPIPFLLKLAQDFKMDIGTIIAGDVNNPKPFDNKRIIELEAEVKALNGIITKLIKK